MSNRRRRSARHWKLSSGREVILLELFQHWPEEASGGAIVADRRKMLTCKSLLPMCVDISSRDLLHSGGMTMLVAYGVFVLVLDFSCKLKGRKKS